MKKTTKLIPRCMILALVGGAFFVANSGLAQNSGTSNATDAPSPNPTSTMGAGGVKASRAESHEGSAASGMSTSGTSESATSRDSSSESGSSSASGSGDREFVNEAAKGGMMEVHMGQMAEKQGQSDSVKQLGKMMVTDHTKANTQLMAIAKRKGITPETDHDMDKLDSSNFDQAWLAQMVKDHQKTIALFERESKNGKDADLKKLCDPDAADVAEAPQGRAIGRGQIGQR